MSILALCPSRERPGAAAETLASFKATIRDKGSRILFVVDADDPTLAEYPKKHTLVVPPTGTMGDALRSATTPETLGDCTSAGMIGDDNRFRTPGWDVVIDGYLTDHIGVAYGDDGIQHARLPTAWWVSRPLVDAFGVAPAGLRHLYMDNWWKSLAEGAGCLRYFPDISIEHLHPLGTEGHRWITSVKADATYRRGNSPSNADHDRTYFHRWERRGRHADIRKAKSITRGKQKLRVLADWHHPALWESLSILFEDRFGWELYSMAGDDWKQNGWTLDNSGPPIGWTASDYLSLEGATNTGAHWQKAEAEYPARPRKMVTTDQAFGMSWDFVLGSVPEHQRSFATLAGRLKARLVHQVGNAKHPLDNGIDQLILASANVRLRSRVPHVVYHQEFDRSVFAPSTIVNPCAVTSLMLRLDWTSCEYRWLSEAPGIRWSAPGGKDPNAREYIAPMSKVAERIAASGWIWHDKRIGDGYGHVLHTAAAMGRPLIGHASHYRGLIGEPFWRDLETAIDLDKHEPKEALRLIRAIAQDPEWHADLGANIRATFEHLVDFDQEAARIEELLRNH